MRSARSRQRLRGGRSRNSQDSTVREFISYNPSVIAYHERLDRDRNWALEEGGKFFMGQSEVNAALRRITARLDELGIPCALAGGMALFQHGYRRFTEDVVLLVRAGDLPKIHDGLEGRGYLPPFAGARNLRDTDAGVAIEFIVAGEYPGDRKDKPVAFPDPEAVTETIAGLRCLNLVTLIELKLASGMTAPHRLRDLAEVQELAKALNLDASFATRLNP